MHFPPATLASLALLALASTSLADVFKPTSTCPDGYLPGGVDATPVCCPGGFTVNNVGTATTAAPQVTCNINCGRVTRTVCGNSTTTGPGLPSSTSLVFSGGSYLYNYTTPLPSGCTTTEVLASTTGVCTPVDWYNPNYMSIVYGASAASSTYGAAPPGVTPPASPNLAGGKGGVMGGPAAVALVGALAGVALL